MKNNEEFNKQKNEFIRRIKLFVDFWEKKENENIRARLEGVTLSILHMLDGKTEGLNDFIIAPNQVTENNLSGNLTDLFYEKNRKEQYK